MLLVVEGFKETPTPPPFAFEDLGHDSQMLHRALFRAKDAKLDLPFEFLDVVGEEGYL